MNFGLGGGEMHGSMFEMGGIVPNDVGLRELPGRGSR